jgi:hypothetical protein
MLIMTAVPPTAIDSEDEDWARRKAWHYDAVNLLRQFGKLRFASDRDWDAFLATVERLPQTLKDYWLANLELIRKDVSNRDVRSDELTSIEALRASWDGEIELFAAGRTQATRLGLPDGVASFTDASSAIAVGRIDLLRTTEPFEYRLHLADRDVPAGSRREIVWTERFEPYARESRTVTLVDQYGLVACIRAARSKRDKPARRRAMRRAGGLAFVLGRLASMPAISEVHLIAGHEDPAEALSAYREMTAAIEVPKTCSPSLSVVEPSAFRDCVHPRHIRFDRQGVLLDRGLRMFDRPALSQATPCRLSDVSDTEARETALERRAVIWRERL